MSYVNCESYNLDISVHETPQSHLTRDVLKLKYSRLE